MFVKLLKITFFMHEVGVEGNEVRVGEVRTW